MYRGLRFCVSNPDFMNIQQKQDYGFLFPYDCRLHKKMGKSCFGRLLQFFKIFICFFCQEKDSDPFR